MRIIPLLLVGLSALALSACDELRGTRQASADCCCKTCPTPPPAKASTPLIEEDDVRVEKVEQAAGERTVVHKTRSTAKRRTYRTGGGYRADGGYRTGGGYRYRSGTEGVGYLDEDLAGGYRGGSYRSVEVAERESYSERYSESESGYGYSEGSYESYGGGRGHKRKRHRDRSYVGTDRYGYLTWPGKTP